MEKSGGFNEANVDFDSVVELSSVKDIKGDYVTGRTGVLDDGSKITVRSSSSDGRPTLELRKINGRGIEYRYGE